MGRGLMASPFILGEIREGNTSACFLLLNGLSFHYWLASCDDHSGTGGKLYMLCCIHHFISGKCVDITRKSYRYRTLHGAPVPGISYGEGLLTKEL